MERKTSICDHCLHRGHRSFMTAGTEHLWNRGPNTRNYTSNTDHWGHDVRARNDRCV